MNVPFINEFTHHPPPNLIPIPLMAKICQALHKSLVCAPITGLKLSSLASKTVDFTDQNINQRGDLMELNFEGLEMQK